MVSGRPRSLGQIVAGAEVAGKFSASPTPTNVQGRARIQNLLVTTTDGLGRVSASVPHPGIVDAPLLAAVAGVDGADLA
ncbi:hypothetical protein [Sedimentibacter sp. B4]|uniref:hypothetical protein n=1 Tax=Sedimentibacter sp. B4 TaxID=304766 RepID=UPI0018DD36ED|nr:hypothetical protein [Sedimentibacter sp. B4]